MKVENYNFQQIIEKIAESFPDLRISISENPVTCKLPARYIKRNSIPIRELTKKHKLLIPFITHIKSGTGKSHSKIKIPQQMTQELAYILGALRDGSLINSLRKHWIRIYDNKKSRWLKILQKLLEDLFEVKFHLRRVRNTTYLDVSSKPLYAFLITLIETPHGDVPEIVKNSDLSLQTYYLAGFFDAEGYVPINSKRKDRIMISQKNKNSLIFLKFVLSRLKITSSISHHLLFIYGKENLKKFYSLVPFLHPDKKERLRRILRAL